MTTVGKRAMAMADTVEGVPDELCPDQQPTDPNLRRLSRSSWNFGGGPMRSGCGDGLIMHHGSDTLVGLGVDQSPPAAGLAFIRHHPRPGRTLSGQAVRHSMTKGSGRAS